MVKSVEVCVLLSLCVYNTVESVAHVRQDTTAKLRGD